MPATGVFLQEHAHAQQSPGTYAWRRLMPARPFLSARLCLACLLAAFASAVRAEETSWVGKRVLPRHADVKGYTDAAAKGARPQPLQRDKIYKVRAEQQGRLQ